MSCQVRFTRGKIHDLSAMCAADGCDWSATRGLHDDERVAVAKRARDHVRETGHEVDVRTERTIYYFSDDRPLNEGL